MDRWGADPGLIHRVAAYDDFIIPAAALILPTTAGAVRGTVETSIHKLNFDSVDFISASETNAQIGFVLPDWWDEGSIKLELISFPAAGASNGDDYVWGVKAVAVGDGDQLDQAFGTEVTVAQAATAASAKHSVVTPEIVVAGSPQRGDWLHINIARKIGDAGDNMAEDARLIGVRPQWRQRVEGPTQW